MDKIPEVINNYNVYGGASEEKLIGISGEITLPSFDMTTHTMTGAGILGEIENPVVGQFKSTDIEIPFRMICDQAFSLMRTDQPMNLTIRGSQQYTDAESGATSFTQVRVVIRGKCKGFEGGKMKIAEETDTKVKAELWYILIEVGGKTLLELDKLNSVYVVDGVDMLAEVNKYC